MFARILSIYRYCPQDRDCGHMPNALRANRAYATRSPGQGWYISAKAQNSVVLFTSSLLRVRPVSQVYLYLYLYLCLYFICIWHVFASPILRQAERGAIVWGSIVSTTPRGAANAKRTTFRGRTGMCRYRFQ
jgi:hypothetical protein